MYYWLTWKNTAKWRISRLKPLQTIDGENREQVVYLQLATCILADLHICISCTRAWLHTCILVYLHTCIMSFQLRLQYNCLRLNWALTELRVKLIPFHFSNSWYKTVFKGSSLYKASNYCKKFWVCIIELKKISL